MIDKLELLLALAKERHFGRAAEACGVTQPTMSTSLKQLEEILGVMLVQRGSRFQGFTPEGERTLDWARRIVGDARAMRQEINSLKDKLSGEIRIAAIPTVLGMVASLTTPFRAWYPDVRFRVQSCTSADVLGLLENLEVDAGLTYIENEPIGKVRTIPLYNESYRLLTSPDAMFGDRKQVTWKEVGQVPLCLLTPDMQNRRIIDRALKSVGAEAVPTLTSNSLLVLYTHVKTGRWASVMPAKLAETLGLAPVVRLAPAKLNLSLAVIGRRPDGFHERQVDRWARPRGLGGRRGLRIRLPPAHAEGLGEEAGLPQNAHRWRVAMARIMEREGDHDAALRLLADAQRRFRADYFPDLRPIAALRARVLVAQGRAEIKIEARKASARAL